MRSTEGYDLETRVAEKQEQYKAAEGQELSREEDVYKRQVLTHEGAEETTFAPYATDGDKSVALLIAPPYDEVYIHFLYMQTDQRLGEIDRYNNDAALYNQGMLEARQAYNRQHMPLQGSRLRNIFPIYDPPRDSNDPLA